MNKSNYDEVKRSANYHVRQAKYEYERSIATNMKEDNKIFWKFIQSKTKSKENIPCIMDENGEVQMNNKIKAELLNKFFKSVFTIEVTFTLGPCCSLLGRIPDKNDRCAFTRGSRGEVMIFF